MIRAHIEPALEFFGIERVFDLFVEKLLSVMRDKRALRHHGNIGRRRIGIRVYPYLAFHLVRVVGKRVSHRDDVVVSVQQGNVDRAAGHIEIIVASQRGKIRLDTVGKNPQKQQLRKSSLALRGRVRGKTIAHLRVKGIKEHTVGLIRAETEGKEVAVFNFLSVICRGGGSGLRKSDTAFLIKRTAVVQSPFFGIGHQLRSPRLVGGGYVYFHFLARA